MNRIKPRQAVTETPYDQHGAFDFGELQQRGIQPENLIDFSVNSNPFGPSPRVPEAIRKVRVEVYPDRECLALRKLLSQQHAIPVEQIVVGNGAAELIWLTAFAFLQSMDNVLILGPTFGEYARSAHLMGATVHEIRGTAFRKFMPTSVEIRAALERHQPKLMFLCNPNNPTGTYIPSTLITDWARSFPKTLFVVDEAYIRFAQGAQSVIAFQMPNVLSIRSLTKDLALAGLRIGYAVGPLSIIDALAKCRPPWSVNATAQAAAVAALRDVTHLNQTLEQLRIAKSQLFTDLSDRLKFDCMPSHVHYFLMNVGEADVFRARLLEYGIQVRDCTSFGLPDYVRIATRAPQENQTLVEALRELN